MHWVLWPRRHERKIGRQVRARAACPDRAARHCSRPARAPGREHDPGDGVGLHDVRRRAAGVAGGRPPPAPPPPPEPPPPPPPPAPPPSPAPSARRPPPPPPPP